MKFINSVLFIFFFTSFFGQKNNLKSRSISNNEKVIFDYSKIDKDSFNLFITEFMNQAYLTCQDYIPQYRALTSDFLSRAKIIELNELDLSQIKNISDIGIKNKCNSNLNHSIYSNFDLNKFNPIIYSIDFLKNQDQKFRLYNSNLVLYVKKKS